MQISASSLPPISTPQELSTSPGTDVAADFESLLASQLIKQMRSTTGEEGMFPGDDSDTLGGMFDMVFGQFIAQNGGFGIADHLEPYLPGADGKNKSADSTSPEVLRAAVVPDAIRRQF